MLNRIIQMSDLRLTEVDKNLLVEGFKISDKYQIDLADACAVAILQKYKIQHIYSLDSNFDKFQGIQRITVTPDSPS